MAALIGGKNNDVLAGGGGADWIYGAGGNDTLSGNGGDDTVDGGAGDDTISGGSGNDTLKGSGGNDTIAGGDGRDVLIGGAGNDALSGDAGDDRLEGGSGNDTLNGGSGNDDLQGGDGDDTFVWNSGAGNDTVRGGSGRDTFVVTTSDTAQQTVRITAGSQGRLVVTVEGAGGGVTTLQSIEDLKFVVGLGGATIVVGPGVVLPPLNLAGSDGANVIDQSASNQSATIDAGGGDDVVLGGDAADTIRGGDGDDAIDAGGAADNVDGGRGNDRVVWAAGDGDDVVQGGDGVDELEVALSPAGASTLAVDADAAGNVILTSSSGEHITADGIESLVINASAGGSTVTIGNLAGTDVAQNTIHFVGGAGADTLDASATDRRVDAQGNGGNDTLLGGSAGDSLAGGADNDTLRGNGGNDSLDGGAGIDTVDYSTAANGVFVNLLTGVAIDGSGGTDTLLGIENANGSGFADELTGNDAANALAGSSGNDTLRGNGGADAIGGGDGNDSITGGAGDDTLTGGVGSDRYFVVDSGSTIVNVGNDTITDFAPDDVIDLSPVPTISSLTELQATSRQEGADTVIDLGGGNSIRLTGVALGNLAAANFVFATPIVGTANNDSLQGTLGNDRILGLGGNDFLEGRAGSDVLDGGDGADIAFYLLDANAVIANLSAAPITVDGITVQPNTARDGSGGTDTLISIEAVAGSNFGGDTLVGGAAADSLNGFGGADTLIGGGGDDLLSGGAGVDIMDGGAGFDVVLFGSDPAVLGSSLLQIAVNGDGSITSFNTSTLETETIVNVEMAVGSLGNDSLIGNAGNDFLGGNFGSDVINGGAGIDTAVYVFNAGAVLTIDLASGTATETFTPPPPPSGPPPPTFNATDTLIGIENVRGSASNETIIGNSGNNVLEGYLGNDLLRGGAGNDTLNGGASLAPTQPGVVLPVAIDGTDTVDYSTDPNAVTVNLLTGVATDGFGSTDTLLSIENANGSGFNDTITGNDAANVLAGLAGNDTLIGNAGADTIDGGDGNDSITGGAGNDTLRGGAGGDRYFVVDPGQTTVNIGNDTIDDFASGDAIDLTPFASITSLAQVLAISRQEGADAVIDLGGGNSIRLTGVALGSLTAANFVLAAPPPPIVGTPGADFLNGTPGNDTILGLGGNDFLQGLAGSDVLDGGAGTDLAVYTSEANAIVANLSADAVTVGGVTVQSNTVRNSVGDTDTLVSIEVVFATNQGDTLIGSAGADTFSGLLGADTIEGRDGNDSIIGGGGIDALDGGAGFDNVFFSADPAPLGSPSLQITVNADGSITSVHRVTGETETNIVNFEMVIGSLGNDLITGTAGNDLLGGEFGSDVIDGGAGIDTAIYTFRVGSVQTIDLASGTSLETTTQGPPGQQVTFTGIDTLIDIENARGSSSNESIFGNAGANILEGFSGNDVLRGGGGNDTLNGGASMLLTNPEALLPVELDGTDTVDYSTDPNGVTVNLLTGTATDGFGGTDTLISIENADGSAFADTITGNDAANVIQGLGGNDTLRGNAGADTILGGDGADSITGGAGNDTLTGSAGADRYFVVDPGQTVVNIGNDTITDFVAGDVIDLTPVPTLTSLAQVLAISRQEGADAVIDLGGGNSIRLTGVALGSLTAASFAFAAPPPPIVGTANADTLQGTPGDDTILGLGGNDVLNGLAGSDTLDGGDGSDAAFYINDTGSIIANLSAAPIIVGGVTVQPNTVRDGSGATDTLISIEALVGSNQADTLVGGVGLDSLSGLGGADTIDGGAGNDLISGGAGVDLLDGGTGFDIALFSGDPAVLGQALLQITINPDGSITSFNTRTGETETSIINFEMTIGSLGNDTVTGSAGNDFLGGGFGSDAINGGAGIDTVVYTFNTGTVLTIDLASGTSSETLVPPAPPGFPPPPVINAADTLISIENVRGSGSSETIIGNAANNVLEGGAGDDVMRGNAGNDTLSGGASVLLSHPEAVLPVEFDGTDTVDYSTDPTGVAVNLLTGVATDGFGGTDTLVSIENANGSNFNDTITGNDAVNMLAGLGGNDTLLGNAGADTISGGDGNDSITGGAGNDTLTGGAGGDRYFVVDPGQTAVNIGNDTITDFVPGDTIDLTPVTSITSLAQVLAVSRQEGADAVIDLGGGNSIRLTGAALGSLTAANFVFAGGPQFPPGSIVGTDGPDGLIGTPGNDVFFGLGGNDLILANVGSDTIDGGDGNDSVSYSGEPGPLIVNLSAAPITVGGIVVQSNTVRDVGGGIDTLISVENVSINSNNFADTLIGSAGSNQLGGGTGADTIFGGDGLDTISGGAGIDILDGGAGFDIVLFSGDPIATNAPGLQITVNPDGSITSVNPLTGETETAIVNFEMLSGSQGNDIITGNAGNNMLGGGFGSDLIDGGTGIDTVNYQFNLAPIPGAVLTVDLAAGTSSETLISPSIPIPGVQQQTFTASDTLINIENVSGTLGVDNLYGDAGDNVLQGFLGDDLLRGGAGNDTLDGNVFTLFTHLENTGPSPTDGSDTADYSIDPNGVDVNLATGVALDGFGDTDTLVSIENVLGSAFADTLTGSDVGNALSGLAGVDTLSGGAGDDRLAGGSGVDVIDGGAGFDILDYSADAVAASAPGLSITIDGTTVTAVNAALGETEVATNVEAVVGSLGDDVVIGDGADNLLIAGGGDDQFDGGGGSDTVRFDTAAVVDLAAGTAQVVGGTLVLTNVENATASASADLLRGSAQANTLVGGLGDDVLMGRGGADTLIGGNPGVTSTDVDTADYSEDAGPVAVNLAAGTAVDGSGATDTLVSIERAVGSQFADTLIGDGGSNVLTGLGGNDLLTGGAGVDTFVTTADAGGNAAFGNDTVTDFNVAQDVVSLRAFPTIRSFADAQSRLTQDGADAVITVSAGNSIRLQNVNVASLTANNFLLLNLNIIGTDASETLTGDIGDDNIQGRGGNDTLLGLAGNDTLDGGAGIDTLNGGPGNDTLLDPDTFGVGTTMIGGAGNDAITGGTPDYATDPAAIIANLSTVPFDVNGDGSLIVAPRTVLDGYGGTDTLAGTISNFEATYFNDTVVGGAGNEQFFLFAGNDRALGGDGSDAFQGGSGDDFIDGGAGTDSLNYTDLAEDGGPAAASQGIRLNLSSVAVDIGGGVILAPNGGTDNYGNHDTVFNIEVVNGSRFADVIVGSATTLQLIGNDGNDTLLGGSGNETLSGGAGNDVIDGGAGTDSVSFGGPSGAIVNLLTQTASDGQGGTDVIRNVETIFGTSFADALTGDDNNNTLFGSGGSDVLLGNGGADSLDGSDGNDTLVGGDGNDQLNGGRNDDLLTGSNGQDTFTFVRNTLPPTGTDFGVDVITDFSVGVDVLNVSQVSELSSLTAVLARATQNPQGVLISINAQNSIQLNGLTLADVPLMNIIFAPIVATPGDDILDGTEAANFIDGLAGNDTINGRGGNDNLFGSDGNDVLNGGDGTDSLSGGNGNDTLNGDAGDDFLDSGGGNDTMTGGAGADNFRPTTGLGGVGLDVITDLTPSDRLDLTGIASMTSREALSAASSQVGADVVITVDLTSSITIRNFTLAQLDAATVFFAPFNGTPGNDTLNGLNGSENINGLGGDDVINGNGGSDSIFGGDGNDTLNGGRDNDALFGDAGNDTLNGDDGTDSLFGGNGNDILVGGAGFDNLDGGAGDDTSTGGTDSGDFFRATLGRDVITDLTPGSDSLDLTVFTSLNSHEALAAAANQVGADVVITIDVNNSLTLRNFTVAQLPQTTISFAPLNGTPGNDVLNGSAGSETINGLGGDDVINGNAGGDGIFGGDGNDTLNGGQGNDTLSGDAGDDTLNADDGTDSLFGGNGNDTLVGGAGFDNLDGGAGDDTSTGGTDSGDYFRATLGHDVITDLTPGSDSLDLAVFPSLTSYETLAAVANQVGADVVITIDGNNSLTLRDFTVAQLLQTSITFAPLTGTEGNDILSGSAGSETIGGLGGDDIIDGNGGSDTVFGGAGNDTLNGGDGADWLMGEAGNDTLTGGADSDQLDGGAGNDTLTGGAATDFFQMNLGHDVITDFALAEDQLHLGQIPTLIGRDALLAASSQQGNDVLIAIDANNSITIRNLTLAELGSAIVAFAPINGTAGNDVLNGTSSSDTMNGLAGDDVLNGLGGSDVIAGQEGSDTLNGGDGDDLLLGSVGNDSLNGGDGNDTLEGGTGDDTLTGGAGSDSFRGLEEEGDDVITDFTGDDRLELGSVPSMVSRAALLAASTQVEGDVVITIDGDSTLTLRSFTLAQLATANVVFASFNGTEGNDVLDGTDDRDVMNGLGGDDLLNGNGGSDNLSGGDGSDTLNGGADIDFLYGGNGNDTLNGGDDSDVMYGESGNDTLLGGAEHDYLDGGTGDDVLTGGAGNDTFVPSAGHDTITDFAAANDSLDLRLVPSMSRPSALTAAALQVGNDVVITVDAGHSITLQDFAVAGLAAANVLFAPIIGTDASETIEGSETFDTMFGRGGDDVLNAGEGNDSLFGEGGNDTLNGGSGFDLLNGGLGNDTLNGGSDSDWAVFSFEEQTHGVVADLLTMTALDDGAGGIDSLVGIESLQGSLFDDTLTGDGGANSFFGSSGDDVMRGLGGGDFMQGADGDDTLRGDGGNDFLYGDPGDDLFVFAAGDGADTIADFVAGAGSDDVIDLQLLPAFDSFADVLAATSDDGFGNSIIDFGGGNQITLIGVTESALHADDFLL